MSTGIQQLDVMSPGGNLESYLQNVNSIPLLSAEREAELAEKLFHQGDVDAARQLVLSHLRFVAYVARSFSGYGLSEADLIQEGNVGLMKAVKRFNPEFKVRLVSFAVHWIKAEIHEFILKNWRIVKIATTKSQRKLFFNLRGAKKRLGWMNEQEVNDIAETLGVDPQTVRQMEGRLAARDASFDLDDDDDDSTAPVQYLTDPSHDPAEIVEFENLNNYEHGRLMNAYEGLDARAKEIISSRWLSERKMTLHELAAQFSISAERVRQLEQNALKKLRLVLSPG
ncbi:MAG: RNA polymerase sigma factor RpoH [Pseudomonadales bacterium]|nr:RNA polymerase sigma factor RpoH [Pseudomonadales bacterium]